MNIQSQVVQQLRRFLVVHCQSTIFFCTIMAAMQTDETVNKDEAIALSIVTGLLGSDRTTLINLITITHGQQQKVAIIQNEFGDSTNGVENAFMSGSDGEIFTNVVELASGCVCCTVRDNFALAVEQLASQKKYNYIFIETLTITFSFPTYLSKNYNSLGT